MYTLFHRLREAKSGLRHKPTRKDEKRLHAYFHDIENLKAHEVNKSFEEEGKGETMPTYVLSPLGHRYLRS